MYKTVFATHAATLHDRYSSLNTGADQIMSLERSVLNANGNGYHTTRILLSFDTSEITSTLGDFTGSFQTRLWVFAADVVSTPTQFAVSALPVSESWVRGTGVFGDIPERTDGVSWIYRNGIGSAVNWDVGPSNSSFTNVSGGGTWNSAFEVTQSLHFTNVDLRLSMTNIVSAWISGSIANNGIILKFPDSVEASDQPSGIVNYFSPNTHTIFPPRLEIVYDDSVDTQPQISEISNEYVIYLPNLSGRYNQNSKNKILVRARNRVSNSATYSATPRNAIAYRLPQNTYYSVKDMNSGETIIPFDTIGTKLSCDANGNYFWLDMSSLMPERIYGITFRMEHSDSTVRMYEDYFKFKVIR